MVTRGWLRKDSRLGIMLHLKLRFFVLLDNELRYYKHPDDSHAAGIINLEEFDDVRIYNTTHHLYGFKLITTTKEGHCTPMFYANSEEERQRWSREIREKLCNHHDNDQYSVLDKWLHKLNLYDDKDLSVSFQPFSKRHPSRSSSGSTSSYVPSPLRNISMESVGLEGSSNSSNNSMYSEPTSFDSYHSFYHFKLHNHLFDKYNPDYQSYKQQTPPIPSISESNTSSSFGSFEPPPSLGTEQQKYTEITNYHHQLSHQRHSAKHSSSTKKIQQRP